QEPYSLPQGIKFVIFLAGVIISRKLWKAKPREAERVDVDYSLFELKSTREENAQGAAAQKTHDDTQAALSRRENEISEKIARLTGRASALALHARRVAQATMSNATAELDRAIPKFKTFVDSLEWSNPVR